MLKEICFKNYKAFDIGKLNIKPITILLGANSIGKTSILQLILMLQQTALSNENYKAALKLHGGFLSLGEGKNIFRKQNVEKPVSLRLNFENESLSSFLKQGLLKEKIEEIYEYVRLTDSIIYSLTDKGRSINENLKNFQRYFSKNRNYTDDSKIDDKLISSINFLLDYSIENTKTIKKRQKAKEFLDEYYLYRLNKTFRGIESKRNEIVLGLDFIKKISKMIKPNTRFGLEFEICLKENVLLIKSFNLFIDEDLLFQVTMELHKEQKFNFHSPLLDNPSFSNKINDAIKKYFVQPRTIFSFVREEADNNSNPDNLYFIQIAISIINSYLSTIDDYFSEENINYVSPLRAHPKRYYFLDKAKINTYLDTLDGDALAEILKENEAIKNQVNEWLGRFNFNVQVSKLEDILHKLTVNQNSLNLDITDVGFGLSQVLPVIIQGFLSFDNSITLIEQPEIHLHPKMQADLADLFINIAIKIRKNRKIYKNLIIETHSEYLLRRLRRRISEGIISPDDVAIYLVKRNTDGVHDNSIIEELTIEAKGNFDYPIEFYGGELLKDEIVFLKNQA